MDQRQGKLVRFLPCACFQPSFNAAADLETIRQQPRTKLEFKKESFNSRGSHRAPTPLSHGKSKTTTIREQGNSSEDGYISASQPSNRTTTATSVHRPNTSRTTTATSVHQHKNTLHSSLSRTGRESGVRGTTSINSNSSSSSRPKLHLGDGCDGVVIIHIPGEEAENEEEEEETQDVHAAHPLPPPSSRSQQQNLRTSNSDSRFTFTSLDQEFQQHQQQPEQEGSSKKTKPTTITNEAAAPGPSSLEPVTNPQTVLQDIGLLINVNDKEHVLAALLLLRRGIRHHKYQLVQCLGELLAVITVCLQSSADIVVLGALTAGFDLVRVYSDLVLQHMKAQEESQHFLVELLTCAASSKRPTQKVKTTATELLNHMAASLHQSSIVKMLDDIAQHHSRKEIKSKAASILLIATYRLS